MQSKVVSCYGKPKPYRLGREESSAGSCRVPGGMHREKQDLRPEVTLKTRALPNLLSNEQLGMGKTSPSADQVAVEGMGQMTAVAQEGGCERCNGGVPVGMLRQNPGEADPKPSWVGAMPQAS